MVIKFSEEEERKLYDEMHFICKFAIRLTPPKTSFYSERDKKDGTL
jgi:hypothetical protein